MRVPFVAILCCLGMFSDSLSHAQDFRLNEIMVSNDLAHYDDFFEFDDWVEIFNAGGLGDLAGHHISDNPDNLTKYTFPSSDPGSTFMTPGAHALIWCDKDSIQGVMHANFKLSAENEGVWLTAPDGLTVLDSIVYPPQQTDISYGRSCDGCEDWVYFNVPTPEEENAQEVLPTPSIYINEVLLENTAVLADESFELEPWLEVFNPNPFQVNLGGYTVETQGAGANQSYTLPTNSPVETTVAAGGFLLFWLDGEPEEGGHHLGLLPEPSGQTFKLVGPDEVVADSYPVSVSFANVSWGREVDGASSSDWFDIPTPRVTNSLVVIQSEPVVINECQSVNLAGLQDGMGEFDDWVEIHNPADYPVDLAGYFLTDRLNNPIKWQFPLNQGSATVIEPQGYMLLWADEDGDQGWSHMNFKLSGQGEALVLRSPDGFTIADSVHFGASVPDNSYARLPDGSGPFAWITDPTPGSCNDCSDGASEPTQDKEFLYRGRNPLMPGQAFVLSEPVTVNGMGGNVLMRLQPGRHFLPDMPPGMYFLRSARGKATKLVVCR